jgi:predicted nucleic acid-binding Zn ribbon protein
MESVAHVLSRVLRELGLEQDVLGWRVVDEWPRLVGPRVAHHTRAVAYRSGTVHVEVEGSAWMHELGFLKRELIREINRQLGSDQVRDVRFLMPRGRRQRRTQGKET